MQVNHPELVPLSASVCYIGHGAAGIRATTRHMARIAYAFQHDPNIRARAISITQLEQPKNEPAEVRALYDFVRGQIRYVRDVADVETVQTPDKTLALRAGDCDDVSLLLVTLLRTIGYDAFFIVTGYTMPGEFEHVYVGVRAAPGSDRYIALDPTESGPMGWEAPHAVARYIEEVSP